MPTGGNNAIVTLPTESGHFTHFRMKERDALRSVVADVMLSCDVSACFSLGKRQAFVACGVVLATTENDLLMHTNAM